MAINFNFKKKDQEDIDDIITIGGDETIPWGGTSVIDEEPEAEEENDNGTFSGINESAVTLKLITPKSLGEVVKVADYLKAGSSVVLNIEELEESDIIRFMDYLQGVLYIIEGNMKQVSKTTFVATPNNVGIESDVAEDEGASEE